MKRSRRLFWRMDLEYELHPEFHNARLSELLEASVTCFRGVGDVQRDLLEQYFDVETVQDLACLLAFEAALEMYVLLLEDESHGGRTIRWLMAYHAGPSPLKKDGDAAGSLGFAVSPEALDRTLDQVLHGPLQALESISPPQSGALYDAFRTSTPAQLAQNQVMLEARLVLYLVQQGEHRLPEKQTNADLMATLIQPLQQRRRGGVESADQRELLRHRGRNTMTIQTETGKPGSGGEDEEKLTSVLELRNRFDGIRSRAQSRARSLAGNELPAKDGEGLSRQAMIDKRTSSLGERRVRQVTVSSRREAVLRQIRERIAKGRAERGFRPSVPSSLKPVERRNVPSPLKPVARPPKNPTKNPKAEPELVPPAPQVKVEPPPKVESPPVEVPSDWNEEPRRERRVALPRVLVGLAALVVILVLSFIVFSEQQEPPSTAGPSDSGSVVQESPGYGGAPPAASPEGTVPPGGEPSQAADDQVASSPQNAAAVPSSPPAVDGSAADSAEESTGSVPAAPPPPAAGALSSSAGTTTHRIVEGETLWDLGRRYYEDPFLWRRIYEANRDLIGNPDLIYPDQPLQIPPE